MIEPAAEQWIVTTNWKQRVATQQLEEALLSIEERQSERKIAHIFRSLSCEIRGLLDSDIGTVANTAMKWLKAIKADIAKRTHESLLLNTIIDGTWPTTIPEAEEAPTEESAETDSNREFTVRQPQAASLTLDEMAEILQQMTALVALVENQQSDIDQLKQRNQKPKKRT